MSKQPFLADDRIGIRRFHFDDVQPLFDAVRESVNELCTNMTWCHPDYSLEDSRYFIVKCDSDWEMGLNYNCVIINAGDGTLLGSVALNRLDRKNNLANVGYWVRRSHTGRSVATTALRLIASFGLKKLKLQRLEILVPVNNMASRRVAQKAGARFEGILRNRLTLRDGLCDAAIFSLIAQDLVSPKRRWAFAESP